jgi:hypothetical protein
MPVGNVEVKHHSFLTLLMYCQVYTLALVTTILLQRLGSEWAQTYVNKVTNICIMKVTFFNPTLQIVVILSVV